MPCRFSASASWSSPLLIDLPEANVACRTSCGVWSALSSPPHEARPAAGADSAHGAGAGGAPSHGAGSSRCNACCDGSGRATVPSPSCAPRRLPRSSSASPSPAPPRPPRSRSCSRTAASSCATTASSGPSADPPPRAVPARAPLSAARAAAAKRTVRGELRRMLDGRRDRPGRRTTRWRAIYDDALRELRSKLRGARRAALGAVLRNLEDVAARGGLTARALPALFETVARNRQWWSSGPLLRYGARVELPGQPAGLAVLHRRGPADPVARHVRQGQRAVAVRRARRGAARAARRGAARWPPSAPAASPGSTCSASTAAARRGSAALAQGTGDAGALARGRAPRRAALLRGGARGAGHLPHRRRPQRRAGARRRPARTTSSTPSRRACASLNGVHAGAQRPARLRACSPTTPRAARCSPPARRSCAPSSPRYDTGAWSRYSLAARGRPRLPQARARLPDRAVPAPGSRARPRRPRAGPAHRRHGARHDDTRDDPRPRAVLRHRHPLLVLPGRVAAAGDRGRPDPAPGPPRDGPVHAVEGLDGHDRRTPSRRRRAAVHAPDGRGRAG